MPPYKNTALPSRQQILDFIASSETSAGKRDIARALGLKGQERIALKHLLRDMAEEGLIDGGKTAYHRMGGVPKVTVLRVVAVEDGEPIAIPDSWQPDDATPPPRLRLQEKKKGAALGIGCAIQPLPVSSVRASTRSPGRRRRARAGSRIQ